MAKRIAVTGSTGLIGEALVRHLRDAGHTVVRVVRERPVATGDLYWSPSAGEIDAAGLEGLDGVVHLAGAPIGPRPWTRDARRSILESRREGTALIASALAGLSDPPPVLVSGSAVGWYGYDRGDEILTEASNGPGDGFLADVCRVWEDSARPAVDDDRIRVVFARTGLVMSRDGGLLPPISIPFRLGVGGKLGSGEQWMSWISIEDEAAALAWLLATDDVSGPVNLTAPNPVTNATFTKTLGRVLRRPTVMTVPRAVLTTTMGDMAREMMLASQRAAPTVLDEHGYAFRYRDLEPCLRAELGR